LNIIKFTKKINFFLLKKNNKDSSNSVKTNDVCSTSIDITQSNGFITSPSYPSFTQQNKTCLVKINVPAGKSVNIWAVDVSIGNRAASGA